MARAELSRRVEKVVGYPPLSEMGERQRREFPEALLDTDSFEDPPGKRGRSRLAPRPGTILIATGVASAHGSRASPPSGTGAA